MPVSNPTLLISAGSQTGSTSQTTSTFTPTAGNVIAIGVIVRDNNPASVVPLTSTSIVDTFVGTGAWSEATPHADSTLHSYLLAFARLGATPGAGAITVNFANSTGLRKAWVVCEMSGVSTVGMLSESTFNETGASTATIDVIADIISGNLLLAGAGAGGAGTTQIDTDTDFTQLSEVVSGITSPFVVTEIAYDPNDNQTSGTFGSTSGSNPLVLAEFAQDTGAAAANSFVLELRERHYPRGYHRGVLRGAIRFVLPQPQLSGA